MCFDVFLFESNDFFQTIAIVTFSYRYFEKVKTAGERLQLFIIFNIYEAEKPIKNDLQACHVFLNKLDAGLQSYVFCSQKITDYE